MKMFPSGNVKSLMEKMGLAEDQPIQAKLVSRSIENAQTRIEGQFFDMRKSILQYDSILNTQRTSVYEKRRNILNGGEKEVKEYLSNLVDGDSDIQKIIDEKIQSLGEEEFYKSTKRLILQVTDMFWMDHLETMSYIRSSVGLRAYGQRDPLIEYTNEGKRLFNDLQESIKEQIIKSISNIGEGAFKKEEERLKETVKKAKLIGGGDNKSDTKGKSVVSNKIGRNDLVTIVKDGEEKQVKYKKAEPLLNEGWAIK
jgi:preprotein translocase subunit SecA